MLADQLIVLILTDVPENDNGQFGYIPFKKFGRLRVKVSIKVTLSDKYNILLIDQCRQTRVY